MPLTPTGLQNNIGGIGMNNGFLKIYFLLLMALQIVGCAHPITIVGEQRPANDLDKVVIYYPDLPKCNFKYHCIYSGRGRVLFAECVCDHIRLQAAKVGADAVYIMQTQRLDIKEFAGVAKAIQCETT